MDKITLVVGNNFEDVNAKVIKKINVKDLTKQNIIIVPDRFSLICEKLVFETLNISSTFNIDVRGISGFARYVFKLANLKNSYVSKNECKILVRHAIKSVQKDLCVFKGKINQGIIEMIYDAIISFKTNEITPENVCIETEDKFLGAKLKDLQKIYFEYEKLLDGKLDDCKVLDMLSTCLGQVDLSNVNLFYVNFDSFTKQGYSVLKAISKVANSLTVGTILPDNQINSYIYEKEIYDEILFFAKESGVEVTVEKFKDTLTNKQQILHKNLFALKKQKTKLDYVHIFEASSPTEEVENFAKIIKKLVVQGVCFNDINIMCGNLTAYKPEINRVFTEFGFSYYLDEKSLLSETNVVKFIIDVLNLLKQESNIEDFLKVALSDYSGLSKEQKVLLKEFTEKYEVKSNFLNDKLQNVEVDEIKNIIVEKINKLKIIEKNIKNYLFLIKNIIFLFNLQEINANTIKYFEKLNYKIEEKIYSQIFDSIDKICESLEDVLPDSEFEYDEFVEIFQDAVSNLSLSSLPLSTDSIFIGDATTSFFEKKKYLFVLGASENNLPLTISDASILNDDVLDKINSKLSLTPTVRMVNRRNRFKLFLNLLQFKEEIFLSYSLKDFSQNKQMQSGFIKDILAIDENCLTILAKTNFKELEKVNNNELANFFAGYFGTLQNAKNEYIKNMKNLNLTYQKIMPSLGHILKVDFEKIYSLQNIKINNSKQLFFENNKTKISQIEKYYACPFSHFASYGLSLKEKETAEVKAMDIGNFLHKVAEEFLNPSNNYINQLNFEEINKIVEKIIKKIEKNNNFNKFLYKMNSISYKILKEESLRFCKYLFNYSTKSNFQPKFLEVRFGDKDKFEISVLNEKFSIVGVVDRIDMHKNNAVIIDYKTGASVKGNFDELFYGEKIQIFVYAKAIEQLKGFNVSGVYYFPILNKISDEEENPYYLKGKGIDCEDFLKNMDTTVNFDNPKSQIFPCAISVSKENIKKNQIVYNKGSSILSEDIFQNMLDYSIEMVKNAIKEIFFGNILPSPIEKKCEFCPYFSICQKDQMAVLRKNEFKITENCFNFKVEEENE